MPIRPAHKLFLALARGVAIVFLLTRALLADENVELTLEQARVVAVTALQNGDPGLAIQMSKGLLQADPRDPLAYYVIARAHAGLSQPNLGRRAAARAYRYSDNGAARFQAAQLAAQMAYAEGKPTLAQIWLRRTIVHAPTEREEALVARDYRVLRAQNPWAFSLRTDLRPSNNVNNGADAALLIIDGVPDGGTIPRTNQALSGLIGSLDISTTYRLRADEQSGTSIGGRLYMQRVALSSAAKDLLSSGPSIPGQKPVRNSDFASTYAELSLRHGFAVGDEAKGGTAAVEVAFGESWYAQQRSYRFGRIRAERKWRLGQGRTRLAMRVMGEGRTKARYQSNDATILGLGVDVQRQLGNGDKIGLTFALRDTDAKTRNGTFSSASMRTSYTFAKSIGPAKLSAGLVFGFSEYPDFKYSLFRPASKREDKSIYGDLSLFFYQYDYAGFAPVLRIRTGRKVSNFSPFSARELSVSLSIQSKF
jgi:hypothetical protein